MVNSRIEIQKEIKLAIIKLIQRIIVDPKYLPTPEKLVKSPQDKKKRLLLLQSK